MKKVLLSLAIVTIVSLSAKAQSSDSKSSDSQIKLDIGATGAIPLGNFGDDYSFGIGGFLKGAYNVSPNVDVTLTAGYKNFSGKTISGITIPSEGIIDFIAGASYLMDGGFHIDGGIGYGLFTPGSSGGFAYRVGAGYKFASVWDVTANYNGVSDVVTTSYIGIGISYALIK